MRSESEVYVVPALRPTNVLAEPIARVVYCKDGHTIVKSFHFIGLLCKRYNKKKSRSESLIRQLKSRLCAEAKQPNDLVRPIVLHWMLHRERPRWLSISYHFWTCSILMVQERKWLLCIGERTMSIIIIIIGWGTKGPHNKCIGGRRHVEISSVSFFHVDDVVAFCYLFILSFSSVVTVDCVCSVCVLGLKWAQAPTTTTTKIILS